MSWAGGNFLLICTLKVSTASTYSVSSDPLKIFHERQAPSLAAQPSKMARLLTLALVLTASIVSAAPAGCTPNGTSGELTWWYESTTHGKGYRNVKDFGAVGDGVTDDTAAIKAALTMNRQPVYKLDPSAVYFPPGTYLVSASLPIYFYTFLSGSPCAPSILKFKDDANFGGYMIDADSGQGEWGLVQRASWGVSSPTPLS